MPNDQGKLFEAWTSPGIAERKRLSRQCAAILALLQSRERVSNAQLAEVALKYTGRISELRHAGYRIDVVASDRASGLVWYELRGKSAAI